MPNMQVSVEEGISSSSLSNSSIHNSKCKIIMHKWECSSNRLNSSLEKTGEIIKQLMANSHYLLLVVHRDNSPLPQDRIIMQLPGPNIVNN